MLLEAMNYNLYAVYKNTIRAHMALEVPVNNPEILFRKVNGSMAS
jgi:hypothetical protein